MGTASCEALEVQAGVLPLSLWREELAVCECTKIMAKVDIDPIKKCLLLCQLSLQEQSRVKIITSFGKMLRQIIAYIQARSKLGCSLKQLMTEISTAYVPSRMSYDTVRRWKKKFESGIESSEMHRNQAGQNLHLVKKSFPK